LQDDWGELLIENRAPHHIQQHSSLEIAQLLQGSLHDGVELQAVADNSCCRCQYPNRGPPDTTAEKTTWLGSGLASSDVHADDDVCPLARLNSTLSEKGECKLVDDRRRHSAVVEEKVQFPREANG
jgi:hypothetical protein